jgi:hypothetical protein
MPRPFVGIHAPLISFVDEGIEPVIERFARDVRANALLLAAHGFNPEVVSRVTDKSVGHGVHEPEGSIGGAFYAPHPEYYRSSRLRETRSPEAVYEGFDLLGDVLPVARQYDMATYVYILEEAVTGGRPLGVASFPQVLEIDAFGRRGQLPCVNHPDYRAWKLAVVEDILKSYPVDGMLWGVERRGPLESTLAGFAPTCVCEHCARAASLRGVDAEAARRGLRALAEYVRDAQQEKPTIEGYLVDFLRVLIKNPAILAWESFFNERHLALAQELYGVAKWVRPATRFGLGVWHVNNCSPLLRAEWDFGEWAEFADFLRPILYHNPAGARFHHYLGVLHRSVLKDARPEQTLPLFYAALGYDEADYESLPAAGFSADYVRRSVRRVVSATENRLPVYAGLGLDIPHERGQKSTTPADVREAVEAAFEGGAAGITVSRNYAEMRWENLCAVGEALAGLGLV